MHISIIEIKINRKEFKKKTYKNNLSEKSRHSDKSYRKPSIYKKYELKRNKRKRIVDEYVTAEEGVIFSKLTIFCHQSI